MKQVVTIVIILCIGYSSSDQDIVKWSFSAKKVSEKTYEVHLTPTVQNAWHIYSQTSPQDAALPTKIHFNKNPLVIVEAGTKEIGKVISKYEDVFEVTVKYFVGQADFVQTVKLKNKIKTNVTGTVEYMACNDEQCTPPQTVSFAIKLE